MKLQITTGAYSAPYICEGSKCETDKALIYEWCEEHDPGEGISNYKLTYLKAGKTVLLQRTGLIRSELKFEAGIRTRGSIETGYGVMDLNIETDYINIPNIFRVMNGYLIYGNLERAKGEYGWQTSKGGKATIYQINY